jgi:hypothetical protein
MSIAGLSKRSFAPMSELVLIVNIDMLLFATTTIRGR